MELIPKETILSWDRFYRGNFINSLSGYKSVSLIATVDKKGNPNLAIFSNLVHLGADPALIAFVNRPREAAPHTLQNIEATGLYTINHIHPDMVLRAHQTSAKYSTDVNEFEAAALKPEYVEGFSVPFVKESRCSYAMKLIEVIPIKHNNTFLVIGELQQVRLDTTIIRSDGFLQLDKIETVASLGIDAYYKPQPLARYSYAKPGTIATNLDEFTV